MLENHRKGLIATELEMVHWSELNLKCYQKVIFLFEQKKLKNSASKFFNFILITGKIGKQAGGVKSLPQNICEISTPSNADKMAAAAVANSAKPIERDSLQHLLLSFQNT